MAQVVIRHVQRWLYRSGRPNRLAKVMNAVSSAQFSAGVLAPRNWVTVEVVGRRSGRTVAFPAVVVEHAGGRYLVSMLGDNTNWVRNVRAADGHAVLRRRGRVPVRLDEVEVADRAPILRRYLAAAPGARPHFPVDRHASLTEFRRIADRYPVFRIVPSS